MDKPQDHEESNPELDLNRRQFLGGVGGVTATLAGGLTGISALSGLTSEEGVAEAALIGPLSPADRASEAKAIRKEAADAEKALGVPATPTNGDEETYTNFIGNYHKCLPHDSITGLVDPAAYNALTGAIQMGTFAAFDAVPLGVPNQNRLLNPLGANAFGMAGPDAQAVGTPAPPSVASAALAADAAEVYWMALARDVSFADYGTSSVIADACADLNNLPGYAGPKDPSTNLVTPQVLFRMNSPGVLDGPMVSQFLLRNWVFDASTITPFVITSLPGEDYMTQWNEWLAIQNGAFAVGGLNPILDGTLRLPRNARDVGMVSAFDRVYTIYLRAAHILQNFCNFSTGANCDLAHPYRNTTKQAGFTTFGLAWLFENLASVGRSEQNTWWSKWNVHRFVRPEEYGGLVQSNLADGASHPIHSDLTSVSTVLPRIFAANAARNAARGLSGGGTYLLSQGLRSGCPAHPSFPAGHAFSAGACVTFLKAFVLETRMWTGVLPTVKPNADGTATVPYVVGVDGPALTLVGELNKLAHNLTYGRSMIGIHFRADNDAGLLQGEEVAIRTLREQMATYPEPFTGFTLTKFDGTTIVIS